MKYLRSVMVFIICISLLTFLNSFNARSSDNKDITYTSREIFKAILFGEGRARKELEPFLKKVGLDRHDDKERTKQIETIIDNLISRDVLYIDRFVNCVRRGNPNNIRKALDSAIIDISQIDITKSLRLEKSIVHSNHKSKTVMTNSGIEVIIVSTLFTDTPFVPDTNGIYHFKSKVPSYSLEEEQFIEVIKTVFHK